MKKWLLYFITINCFASGFDLKYGLGIIQSKDSQVVSVSYEKRKYYALHEQVEFGGWLDPREDKGQKSSLFFNYSIGLKLTEKNFWMESMHGIGFINNTDVFLGGPFQFFHDVGAGIKDTKNFKIGLVYKHVSSAGIYSPNIGRNFVMMRLGFPL